MREIEEIDKVFDTTIKLTLPSPTSITTLPFDAQPITIQPLPLPIKGFVLRNVLSLSECDYFIKQTEEFGYDELANYRPQYRNNKRIALKSVELSDMIYNRVKEYIPQEVLVEPDNAMELTSEFGTEGLWKPIGMNEGWRFCRYTPGGHFAPHNDGYFSRSPTERSFYTLMVYLNGGFEGGETTFLQNYQISTLKENGNFSGDPSKIITKVVPEAGLALVFLHPQLHEGNELKSDLKYILRSEIMYQRQSTAHSLMSEKDLEALKIYQEASAIEEERPLEAMELYRKAFKMSKKLADAYKV